MSAIVAHVQFRNLVHLESRKPLLIGVSGSRKRVSIRACLSNSRILDILSTEQKHSHNACNVMHEWTVPSSGQLKFLSTCLLAVCCIVFPQPAHAASMQDLVPIVESWVALAGPFGPVVFILLYGLAAVLLIPASVLTISAGFLFGPLMGSIIVSIASTFGAGLSFLVGRYFARSFVERKIGDNEKFVAMDKALAKQGAKVVFLMRLSPIFPYSLINYSLGLTKVPFLEYIVASWLGMLPGTIAYTGLGAAGKAAVSAADSQTSVIVYVVGALATLGVTILLSREATKVLSDTMDP